MRTMAQAFNEWMRRYTETPNDFDREFQAVGDYLADKHKGVEPTYGETCAAYLDALMAGK